MIKKFKQLLGVGVILAAVAGVAHSQGFVFGNGTAKPEAPAAPEVRNPKVEVAQRLLARLNLFRGTPNGFLNQATLDAVNSFNGQHGLPATNQVNDSLINAIRRSIWQTQNWSAGNYKGHEKLVDPQGLREAQTLLSKLGFDAGPLDGTFGPQTQVAAEAFQESQTVTVDGLITPTVLMNLRRAVNGAGAGAKDTLRIMNWPDYTDPNVLVSFEKENNVKIIYDIYAGNDDLQSKIRSSVVPFDVVFPTANVVPSMASAGLLEKLDKSRLKNLTNIDPRVDAAMRSWDKEGAYSLPYMWYTFGITWNPKLTAKAFPGRSMESLSNVFDPEVARRFKSCGVGIEDSGSDFVPMAAIAAGIKKWDGKNSINAADQLLARLAGIVKVIPTDQFVDELASGKICVAIGYSGDAVQAQAKSHGGIEYQIPTEGGLLSIDSMAIPANSKNKTLAYAFIDYLLKPQVIAKISNVVGYANANLKAAEFMNESVKSNPAVVPSSASLSRTIPIPILSDQDRQEIAKVWAKFSKY